MVCYWASGIEDTWSVSSNRESGDGYSDILVETDDGETGILLELKYAEDGNLDAACEKCPEADRAEKI